MSLQTGTLVGAPIRVNDSNDTYPSAVANELQGGLYSMANTTARDAIPAARRMPGMQCYCVADGNTYQLANDLVTWNLASSSGSGAGGSGGSGAPGSGGTNADITLLSGNFGAWTPLGSLSSELVNQSFEPSFKSDLQAFPTRAITYIQAQFGINASFAGTSLVIGVLPANSIPQSKIIKYFICQNIEFFLVIDTNGNVSLESKDAFNLPTTSGSPETQPYYIDIFFNPSIGAYTPTVYSYTRTGTFYRNNCGSGYNGGEVTYSQTYTSTVDLATATSIANSDPEFAINGQAYANANGTCTLISPNFVIQNESSSAIPFTVVQGPLNERLGNIAAGTNNASVIPTGTYTSILLKAGPGAGISANLGGNVQTAGGGSTLQFTDVPTPIVIVVSDL